MSRLLLLVLAVLLCVRCSEKKTSSDDEASKDLQTAFSDQFIDGQPVSYYLNSSDIHPLAVDYYHGLVDIREDEQTGTLLNVLTGTKNELTPFYYRCFMNICKNNGNELQNFLGKYCIRLLERNTYYCIKKLRQGSPDYFTGLVANEIYQKEDWDNEINALSLELHLNLENEAPELRKELDLFIVGIKNDIEHLSSN